MIAVVAKGSGTASTDFDGACRLPARGASRGRSDSRDIVAHGPEGYAGQRHRDKIQRDDEGDAKS